MRELNRDASVCVLPQGLLQSVIVRKLLGINPDVIGFRIDREADDINLV
jgi:hypothetical protein